MVDLHVLHVLPTDVPRGAQRYARALADQANRSPHERHELAVLFAGAGWTARPDHPLGVHSGPLHAAGLDPRAVARLRRLVRRIGPDVVVAHGAEALKYAAFLRGTARPKLVCHAIGVASPKATHGWGLRLYSGLFRRADLVTAVSRVVAQELRTLFGVPAGKVRVVPNARDPRGFVPAAPAAGAIPRLVFVGHLTATKRPEVFLEVVSRLRERGLAFEAVIAGSGPLAAQVRERSGELRVDVLGARDDVPDVLACSSVLVFTSVAEGEGMPGVLIEAAMAGLPVVATDAPGVHDVVVDGETGRVVEIDDIEGLVGAVHSLLTDRELARTMGGRARRRAETEFSLEANASQWLQLLADLCPGSRSG